MTTWGDGQLCTKKITAGNWKLKFPIDGTYFCQKIIINVTSSGPRGASRDAKTSTNAEKHNTAAITGQVNEKRYLQF